MDISRKSAALVLLAGLAGLAGAQSADDSETFSVASVKRLTSHGFGRLIANSKVFWYGDTSLSLVVTRAYEIPYYRLISPKLKVPGAETYEIHAQLPDGANKSQIPAMLRNLLATRFHMVVHWETKETPVYSLVVDTGGIKMNRLEPLAESFELDPQDDPTISGQERYIAGFSQGDRRLIRLMIGNHGVQQIHMEGRGTLREIADGLDPRWTGRPVVDNTGLSGEFEVLLDGRYPFGPDLGDSSGIPSAWALPNGKTVPANIPSIFDAVKKIGLRLEAIKAPVKYLVVDSFDRDPTPN